VTNECHPSEINSIDANAQSQNTPSGNNGREEGRLHEEEKREKERQRGWLAVGRAGGRGGAGQSKFLAPAEKQNNSASHVEKLSFAFIFFLTRDSLLNEIIIILIIIIIIIIIKY